MKLNEPNAIIIAAVIGAIAAIMAAVIAGKFALQAAAGLRQAEATSAVLAGAATQNSITQVALIDTIEAPPPPPLPSQTPSVTELPPATTQPAPFETPTRPPPTLSPSTRPNPTDAPVPTPTPVTPTDTPFVPTANPWPTLAPVPTTIPGSILDEGQQWRQGGVGLRIVRFDLRPDDYWGDSLSVEFEFWNYTDQDLILTYSPYDFLATTNFDSNLEVQGFHANSVWCGETTVIVKAGARYGGGDDFCNFTLWIAVDLGNPNLREVIIHATRFSRITDARWRIVLPR